MINHTINIIEKIKAGRPRVGDTLLFLSKQQSQSRFFDMLRTYKKTANGIQLQVYRRQLGEFFKEKNRRYIIYNFDESSKEKALRHLNDKYILEMTKRKRVNKPKWIY